MTMPSRLLSSLRRRLLDRLAGLGAGAFGADWWAQAAHAQGLAGPSPRPETATPPEQQVLPGHQLQFPRDHGAHPGLRTEWWYLTGLIKTAPGSPDFGFQVTFFRSRSGLGSDNPSRFAPRQFIFGHVAIASPAQGQLIHEQAAWRGGFGRIAGYSESDCDLRLPGWSMRREGSGTSERYLIDLRSEHVQLNLQAFPGRPPLLQGELGFSRKGPSPQQASHYYSRPQMRIEGQAAWQGSDTRKTQPMSRVQGLSWMDHEWSNEVLDASAAGWDWMGLNLDDGSSLMAFRIRPKSIASAQGSAPALWSEVRWFDRKGTPVLALPGDASPAARAQALQIDVLDTWQSLRSGARYPVAMRLAIAATAGQGARTLELRPLMPDQEVDARRSTGGFYWEGLVFVMENGRRIGQGYLELTGYAAPMKL